MDPAALALYPIQKRHLKSSAEFCIPKLEDDIWITIRRAQSCQSMSEALSSHPYINSLFSFIPISCYNTKLLSRHGLMHTGRFFYLWYILSPVSLLHYEQMSRLAGKSCDAKIWSRFTILLLYWKCRMTHLPTTWIKEVVLRKHLGRSFCFLIFCYGSGVEHRYRTCREIVYISVRSCFSCILTISDFFLSLCPLVCQRN